MNIAVFGKPLAGKGTMTSYLRDHMGYEVIGTGALLRKEVNDSTDLGKKIEPLMKAGSLIDVDDIMRVIEDAFVNCSAQDIVFDGSPRRVEELKKLVTLLNDNGEDLDIMLVLDVPDSILFDRMRKRRFDDVAAGKKPRDDDKDDVLKDRLKEYRAETEPVIDEAKKMGIFVAHIDGQADIVTVQQRLADEINDYIARNNPGLSTGSSLSP